MARQRVPISSLEIHCARSGHGTTFVPALKILLGLYRSAGSNSYANLPLSTNGPWVSRGVAIVPPGNSMSYAGLRETKRSCLSRPRTSTIGQFPCNPPSSLSLINHPKIYPADAMHVRRNRTPEISPSRFASSSVPKFFE